MVRQLTRLARVGLVVAALAMALAACSQGSPTDVTFASECVLIGDQIYCP